LQTDHDFKNVAIGPFGGIGSSRFLSAHQKVEIMADSLEGKSIPGRSKRSARRLAANYANYAD
jgi:hypothetical protein